MLLLVLGCAPAEIQSGSSDIQATDRIEARGRSDRTKIVNDVWKVSSAVFKSLYAASIDPKVRGPGKTLARHSVTMISNMVRGRMHPVAFYATIKDFETSTNLQWGGGSEGRSVFTTRNCSSGACFGLFQVDVNLERVWQNGAFCRVPRSAGGLDLWKLKGGPDFCAGQFWWTLANRGIKCARLNPKGANPCTTARLVWKLDFIEEGPRAYGQEKQWGPGQWKTMYIFYKNILTALEQKSLPKGVTKENAFDASINRWLRESGMAAGESTTPFRLLETEQVE